MSEKVDRRKFNTGRPRKYAVGTQTQTYRCWLSMVRRCTDPKHQSFAYYGGRGISFDPAWRDFGAFVADMGAAPEGYSLDRVDNEKPYGKDNCRWVPRFDQGRNRRNNVMISHAGQTKHLSEWARELGVSCGTLWSRFDRGWSTHDALTRPFRGSP